MITLSQPSGRLTVTELNQRVKGLLEGSFAPLWLEGEVSNFSSPSSGHWYFTLKDAKSQLRCAMFRGSNQFCRVTPENGMALLVYGQVTLYGGRGDYQMVVKQLEPLGSGALKLAFEQLKKVLAKAGLFDQQFKKALPSYPQRLGVITSPTGAAIHDVLRVLKRRYPLLEVVIYPTAVQGEGAAAQIVGAIELANQRRECELLLLTRGGGSLEDLWSFNEACVAYAIFNSVLPIVSAVGHEIDMTISDFVADCRAATPSAAAELISPDCQEIMQRIDEHWRQLRRQMAYRLNYFAEQFKGLSQRLKQQHPEKQLMQQTQALNQLYQRLVLAQQHRLKDNKQQLQTLVRALHAISPLATLSRGYTITRKLLPNHVVGEVVYSVSQVSPNDRLRLFLDQGNLDCRVESIEFEKK